MHKLGGSHFTTELDHKGQRRGHGNAHKTIRGLIWSCYGNPPPSQSPMRCLCDNQDLIQWCEYACVRSTHAYARLRLSPGWWVETDFNLNRLNASVLITRLPQKTERHRYRIWIWSRAALIGSLWTAAWSKLKMGKELKLAEKQREQGLKGKNEIQERISERRREVLSLIRGPINNQVPDIWTWRPVEVSPTFKHIPPFYVFSTSSSSFFDCS